MSERTRSLRRLVVLQGKIKDIAALGLARAEAARGEVVAQREAMQALLDRDVVTGRLAVLALERTRGLAAEEAAAEDRRRERLADRHRAETRLKLAERVSEAAARQDAAEAERRALERLIEEAVGREDLQSDRS